jgi:uncharacterized protein YqgQ
MKILLTNAPPSGGKDTLAQYLLPNPQLFPNYSLHFERFSRPHKEAFAAMTGAKIDLFYNVEHYEDTKGDVIPWLGVSYRQWQIDFSEQYMKKLYGDDIFTRMFYARIKDVEKREREAGAETSLFVVADCGFNVELQALLAYGVPASDILLMRVHRPGCTYKGDSRSYIYNKAVLSCDIHNDGTKEQYYQRATSALRMWLDGASEGNGIFDYKDGDRS